MTLRSLPYKPRAAWLTILILLIAILPINSTLAQMPDCLSNTYMYGLFSPKNTTFPATGFDSVEIREIAFSNAAVGQLMGGRRYLIRKQPAGTTCPTCPYYYGSSAMAMDPAFGRFYLITQMGSGGSGSTTAFGDKDIVMIDPLAPTATGTVVGTINDLVDGTPGNGPTNMDNYHFVKAAVSPNGWGYAIGVHRQSGAATSTFNPIIRFSLCNTPNCSTMQLVGYITNDFAISSGMNLFNGDITFDQWGNLYFFASALSSATNRYTDSRLFRINAADIPTAPTGAEVPITFLADYDNLDTTGASGVVMDATGNLYLTLRNYDYAMASNGSVYTTEMWRSTNITTASIMSGFGPLHDSLSAGDLAACFFANATLPQHDSKLTAKYAGGEIVNLKWEVHDNTQISHFEIQSSNDGDYYATIATVNASNSGLENAVYSYTDHVASANSKYYRIRKYVKSGSLRFYSNVVKVTLSPGLNLITKPGPNPFIEKVSFQIELKSSQTVNVRLIDQSGRTIISRIYNGTIGANYLQLDALSGIKAGVYVLEITSDDELIREKVIKQ